MNISGFFPQLCVLPLVMTSFNPTNIISLFHLEFKGSKTSELLPCFRVKYIQSSIILVEWSEMCVLTDHGKAELSYCHFIFSSFSFFIITHLSVWTLWSVLFQPDNQLPDIIVQNKNNLDVPSVACKATKALRDQWISAPGPHVWYHKTYSYSQGHLYRSWSVLHIFFSSTNPLYVNLYLIPPSLFWSSPLLRTCPAPQILLHFVSRIMSAIL